MSSSPKGGEARIRSWNRPWPEVRILPPIRAMPTRRSRSTGRLVERRDARVSVFDGGFVVGDGVWEGLRLHKGALLFLERHLDRLYEGAARIRLDIGLDRAALTAEIRRTLEANDMRDGVHLRVMVTRGEKSAPNQDPRNALGPPTRVIVAEYKVPAPALASRGLRLATTSIPLHAGAHVRHAPELTQPFEPHHGVAGGHRRGSGRGVDAGPLGLRLELQRHESFLGARGAVFSSKGEFCFNGVTRANVISLCREHGIALHLGDFVLDHVHGAAEAFVTGTFGGLTPVRDVDGHVLSSTLPGPVTSRLRALYEELKDAQAMHA